MVTKSKIDRLWFDHRTQDLGFSQTEFARRIGLDKGSWSRTLAGTRKMTDDEKKKAARVLGVQLRELLPHVGLPVERDVAGPGTTTDIVESAAPVVTPRLAGTVDAVAGQVHFDHGGLALPLVELQVVGDPWLTGYIVTCEPAGVSATPSSEYEAGIVQLRDGRMLLRKVRAGFAPGLFDLGPFFGFGGQENGVEILGVIPVVGVRRV